VYENKIIISFIALSSLFFANKKIREGEKEHDA
jgi:hypothetical protein